jgi:hypothetical protein
LAYQSKWTKDGRSSGSPSSMLMSVKTKTRGRLGGSPGVGGAEQAKNRKRTDRRIPQWGNEGIGGALSPKVLKRGKKKKALVPRTQGKGLIFRLGKDG